MAHRPTRRSGAITAAAMAIGLLATSLPLGAAAQDDPPAAADCARTDAPNAMQMWERSGGNKGMVDILVCSWNEANPDRPINLSYIVHTDMVAKIAQGIATGDVPDLMGMDLIYAPQFEEAGSLVDITDKLSDVPDLLKAASPGHMQVATYEDRTYGVPLYADVSALFYNKDLFKAAGLDPEKPPTSLAELAEYADQDHRAGR